MILNDKKTQGNNILAQLVQNLQFGDWNEVFNVLNKEKNYCCNKQIIYICWCLWRNTIDEIYTEMCCSAASNQTWLTDSVVPSPIKLQESDMINVQTVNAMVVTGDGKE